MIEWWQALCLAVLQGFTEFLPISSSAHLILPSLLLGWADQGLAFDIAVHVGTLCAVLIYFRAQLLELAAGTGTALLTRRMNEASRLVCQLTIATVPVIFVGLLFGDFIETQLRTLPVLAATTLVFGLLLAVADRAPAAHPAQRLSYTGALLIGVAQALAPIPGVSRSGITITAALLLGLSRERSAHFSFLLSIPVIAGAGLVKTLQLFALGAAVPWSQLAVAALAAGITAYTCIAVFLALIERVGLLPFVYYRVLLAAILFTVWLV